MDAIHGFLSGADMTQWKPITIEAKMGERVLLWTTTKNKWDEKYVDTVLDGNHVEIVQIGIWDGEEWDLPAIGEPTHWMPLPKPPK